MAMAITPVAQATAMAGSESAARMQWSSRTAFALSLALVLVVSTCGSSAASSNRGQRGDVSVVSLLHRAAAPHNWMQVRSVAGGVILTAPATWHRASGDPGSVTFELGRNPDRPLAYLNATPAVAGERLGTWVGFRLHHNSEEGDQHVRLLAARHQVRLGIRTVATCVQDAYSTRTARYIEIACLAQTPIRRTVIVAASPRQSWNHQWRTLTRAVDAIA
jgi:hypothetical protein